MDKTNLVPTANKVGVWTFHLEIRPGIHFSTPPRQLRTRTSSFNLNSRNLTRRSSWYSFCFTYFSFTALFRFGFSSVKQFLICCPKKSSAGDCPVTVCGVLRFRIRKFASRYSRARVLAFLSSTCLVKAILCRVVRWYAGELDPILPHEFGELLSCKLRSISALPITAQTWHALTRSPMAKSSLGHQK